MAGLGDGPEDAEISGEEQEARPGGESKMQKGEGVGRKGGQSTGV